MVFSPTTKKVRQIDHVGKYFSCRGPLNTAPGPQGVVPMVQAGNSFHGRELTARHGDAMLAVGSDAAQLKAFCADMRDRLRHHCRDPGSCKILTIISPIIAATDREAQDRAAAAEASMRTPGGLEALQYFVSKMMGVDFAQFDLDMTGADIRSAIAASGQESEGLSALDFLFKGNDQRLLRDILTMRDLRAPHLGVIGSPETVATKMDELMEGIGGDGFLLNLPNTRIRIAEFCDGVAPILQRRGSVRSNYGGRTFRDNLMAF